MNLITSHNKKMLVFVLSVLLMTGFLPNLFYKSFNIATVSAAKAEMKVGDYVQFGAYSGEPILWRVINIDGSGSPMLFSVTVLCEKDFDVQGSANWENSSIRRWLNSTDDTIQSENRYDEQEPGFLSNFSKEEQDAIKLTPRKSILSSDMESRDGGSELYKYDKYTTGIENTPRYQISYSYNEEYYDNAYYKLVQDKVCLLSEKEIFDAEKVLNGEKVDEYSYVVFRSKEDDYWLRTPYMPSGGTSVIYVNSGGGMDYSAIGYHNLIGIAPAINLRTGFYESGSGTSSDPYIPQISKIDKACKIELYIGKPQMTVNNVKKEIDSDHGTMAQQVKGITLAPITAIIEAMGGSVFWDDESSKIYIYLDSRKIILQVNSKTAFIDGKSKKLKVSPRISKGNILVPLEFVIENLGGTMDWNSKAKKVTIKMD